MDTMFESSRRVRVWAGLDSIICWFLGFGLRKSCSKPKSFGMV